MRTALTLTTALLLTAAGVAAPPEVVPVPAPKAGEWKEIVVPAGEVVVLSAQPASEWDTLDANPPHTFESGKYAVFLLSPGARKQVIVTGPDKAKSRYVLVASGDVPPAPKPPEPPVPPVDPLKAKLLAAIKDDTSGDPTQKAEWAKDLAAVYREIAKAARDDAVTTAGEFVDVARKSAAVMLDSKPPKGVRKLAGVRDGVTAKELALVFASDGPLTDAQRKAAEELFNKLATCLEGLGT